MQDITMMKNILPWTEPWRKNSRSKKWWDLKPWKTWADICICTDGTLAGNDDDIWRNRWHTLLRWWFRVFWYAGWRLRGYTYEYRPLLGRNGSLLFEHRRQIRFTGTESFAKVGWTSYLAICSTHGPVWTENITKVVGIYDKLSRYDADEGVVIAYGSMYGNTEQMAESHCSWAFGTGHQKHCDAQCQQK